MSSSQACTCFLVVKQVSCCPVGYTWSPVTLSVIIPCEIPEINLCKGFTPGCYIWWQNNRICLPQCEETVVGRKMIVLQRQSAKRNGIGGKPMEGKLLLKRLWWENTFPVGTGCKTSSDSPLKMPYGFYCLTWFICFWGKWWVKSKLMGALALETREHFWKTSGANSGIPCCFVKPSVLRQSCERDHPLHTWAGLLLPSAVWESLAASALCSNNKVMAWLCA